jgi:glucose/arabinose dehydrogenase
MNRRSYRRIFLTLATLVLSACGGSSSNGFVGGGGGGGTTLNACGLSATTSTALSFAPEAVPSGGAAIAIERAFPDLSFTEPVALLQAPGDDSCWFVVERAGRVLAFENTADVDSFRTFIDIRSLVDDSANEGGLLAMAFHPDFASNGEVFLSYTADNSGLTSYVSRFTSSDGGETLGTTPDVLIRLTQNAPNHNNDHIAFGPDDNLYIGFGDGGPGNDPQSTAQNNMNLFGSILRIDVDGATPYSIPIGNPYRGNALCSLGTGAANCPELYAWGLRNPWRWSFDRLTGDLWAGDVGQGAWEEVDIIDLGGNYGWPFFEANRCNTDISVPDCTFVYIPPIIEYPRPSSRSVTGGYVYRGTDIPDLVGVYVYADFVIGTVYQYFDTGSGIIEANIDTDLGIVSFAEANDGELYLLDYYGGGIYGIVAE